MIESIIDVIALCVLIIPTAYIFYDQAMFWEELTRDERKEKHGKML